MQNIEQHRKKNAEQMRAIYKQRIKDHVCMVCGEETALRVITIFQSGKDVFQYSRKHSRCWEHMKNTKAWVNLRKAV